MGEGQAQGGGEGAKWSAELQATNSSQLPVLFLLVGSQGWDQGPATGCPAHPDGAASGGPGSIPPGAQRATLELHGGPGGRGWGGSGVDHYLFSGHLVCLRHQQPLDAEDKEGEAELGCSEERDRHQKNWRGGPGEPRDLALLRWDASRGVRSPSSPTHSQCRCLWKPGSRGSPRHQGVVTGESFLTLRGHYPLWGAPPAGRRLRRD